ncbi:MAG: hypothetical protein N2578_05045 [Bdellovibrionaceae bacterium]|nr:hypothetical protein [Pseudobdellovibrionaceae bacterium]
MHLLVSFLLFALVSLFNEGFLGTDEYWNAIIRYIPAQEKSAATIIPDDDVKSPLQVLPMHFAAQTALALGIESPYWQYRFVVAVIGILSATLILMGWSQIFPKPDERSLGLWALVLHFPSLFAYTRPMFESLSAPWLVLTAAQLMAYDRDRKLKQILLATTFVSTAFMLRQQTGICALAVIIAALWHRQWFHALGAAFLGLGLFLVLGIPDLFLRGEFHYSLKSVLLYNVAHGHEYGNQPIWTYFVMLPAAFFFPWFIHRWPTGFWRQTGQRFRWPLLMTAFFVFLHSLFPQKFERFMIPILPLLLMAFVPALQVMWHQGRKIRLATLATVNLVLLIPAATSPAQKNLIELSQWFDANPEIRRAYRIDRNPEWITEAFIRGEKLIWIDVSEDQLPEKLEPHDSLVLSESNYLRLSHRLPAHRVRGKFSVNLIESLAYKLNPKKNHRRQAYVLLTL